MATLSHDEIFVRKLIFSNFEFNVLAIDIDPSYKFGI